MMMVVMTTGGGHGGHGGAPSHPDHMSFPTGSATGGHFLGSSATKVAGHEASSKLPVDD